MNDTTKADHLENLYRAEHARLERMIVRKVGPASAGDVVQDVFTRLWERAKEHITLTPSYLSRCTSNAAIDHIRADRRRRKLPDLITEDQYVAPVATPHQIAAAREGIRHLDDAIRLLPDRTRHIFLLNRVHGCTYDEIVEVMGLSYSTVEREMAKAILACRSAVGLLEP